MEMSNPPGVDSSKTQPFSQPPSPKVETVEQEDSRDTQSANANNEANSGENPQSPDQATETNQPETLTIHLDNPSPNKKSKKPGKAVLDIVHPFEHLIRGYLKGRNPEDVPTLQPRRTLDQYVYGRVEGTYERAKDQVIYRYTRRYHGQAIKIFMVDQLWVWILNKGMLSVSSTRIFFHTTGIVPEIFISIPLGYIIVILFIASGR
jgi:hypothetical protein